MMNKIKKEIEDGMKLIWKKVDPKDLQPGDHTYAYKRYGSCSHHGIYVGGGYVIHFTRTESKDGLLSLSRVESETGAPRPECGYQENTGRRVIKMCLDCFHRGPQEASFHSLLHVWHTAIRLSPEKFGNLQHPFCTRSPEQVVEAVYELLSSNGFGKYDLTGNNCEHFPTYCQTGVHASMQTVFYDACLMKYRELKNCS